MKTADRDVPVCLVRDMIEEQAGVVWSQIFHQQFYEDIEQYRRNRTGLGVTSGIRQNDTAVDFFGAGWMWICGDQQYFAGGVLDALHDLRTSTDGKQNQKIVVVHIGRGLSQKIIGNSPHGAALLPHQDLEQLCRLETFGKAGGVNVGVVVDVLR